ncbi:MAG: hypothetical protein AAF740_09375, partial [Bacteroidota bacterium]
MNIFTVVSNHISNDNIGTALDELRKYVDSQNPVGDDISYSIVNISRELKEIRKREISGLINEDERSSKMANITLRTLNLARSLSPPVDEVEDRSNDLKFYNIKKSHYDTAFDKSYNFIYQGFKIGKRQNESLKIEERIFEILLERRDEKSKLWIDDHDEFGKIYTSTSVLYYLIQRGLSIADDYCSPSVSYLDTIRKISIDKRAKYYFDIQTGRISRPTYLDFLTELRSFQITGNKYLEGGFKPFLQKSRGSGNEENPNKLPKHYGGYTFHCCLVTDVLLHSHLDDRSSLRATEDILNGTTNFL